MKPISFTKYEQIIESSDENIKKLPILTSIHTDENLEIISCWKLSILERIQLLFTGKIFIHVLNDKIFPIKLSMDYGYIDNIIENYYLEEKN